MKPLKLRVTLYILAALVIAGASTFMALQTVSKIHTENQRIRQSVMLRDWVEALPRQSVQDEIIRDLQSYRSELAPAERQTALSDVIQAYSSSNHRLLKKRTDLFISLEKRFVAQLEPQITHLEQQTIYYGSILFLTLLVGLWNLRSFIIRSVFDHLDLMSTRMMDFLNGRYSYHFEVPPQNEIGDLQSTFNAMAQRVLQNMEDLKALDSAKSDFLNIASHELRTPMTSIKGSLGLLTSGVMGELPKDALRLVEIAESETDRLIRLINDILDMAKIEAGKLPLKESWTPLNEVLSNTRKGLLGLGETMGVKVEQAEGPDIETLIDPDRIQQVITNLLSNAIKFSPKGHTVRIGFEVEQESDVIRIFVQDQGKGISPEDQKRIFEKFRQATSADTPLVKGTGLGLAIAKALVEEHNGSIGVESVPGKGSTFYFTLPKWRMTQEPPNKNSEQETQPQGIAA